MENQLHNTPPFVPNASPQPGQPPASDQKPKGNNRGLLIISGIIALVVIAAGLFFLLKPGKTPTPASNTTAGTTVNQTAANAMTPAVTPVTSANVDQALNDANTKIQSSIDQANSDINAINNINTSQDSTNNL